MIKKITLKNGLTIILDQNKNKHRTTAYVNIKAGGVNTKFAIDGQHCEVPFGTAHLLEHYLIEQSIYGNMSKIFSDDYIESNGITSHNLTYYYISTVHDFKKSFIKLLHMVNRPIFQEDKIEIVKQPITHEIKMKADKPEKKIFDTINEAVFKTKVANSVLGTRNDLEKISIEDLKAFHKAFYRPENQVIAIVGNFSDDIVDIIENEYQKFNVEDLEIKKIESIEPSEVISKKVVINDESLLENLLVICYKIDLSNFTPLEKNKIIYYFGYLYENNFSEKSELFNKLFADKTIKYAIERNFEARIVGNFAMWTLKAYTDEFDKIIDILKGIIKNFKIDEKSFSRWKNNRIIRQINLSENFELSVSGMMDNIFSFDLYEPDTVDFINELNIKECQDLIKKIDFSNYTIFINNIK